MRCRPSCIARGFWSERRVAHTCSAINAARKQSAIAIAKACCAAVGVWTPSNNRCEAVAETMGDHQGDVMNRERDEGDQPEKVEAASGLTSTEQARKPGETASERG